MQPARAISEHKRTMPCHGLGLAYFGPFFFKNATCQPFIIRSAQISSTRYMVCSFTGKEKDAETGYGYFGARYMDHELMTMWLSVDPMVDKYPSISPFAYCAWNPVKLIDPDGEEIDDYFSRSGQYLGSDNSKTDNVRIISESTWNGLSKTIDGKIDHWIGYVLSSDFATETRNGMSTEAQLAVYNHYNPTNYNLIDLNSGSGSWGMRTTQQAHSNPVIKIRLEGNSTGLEVCNHSNEIRNLFSHEKAHIDQCQQIGFDQYKQLPLCQQEFFAISSQMADPTWNKTRQEYQNALLKYGEKFGLYIMR